jgi:hypothetical protein
MELNAPLLSPVCIGLALSYSDGLMVANESDSELVTSRFDA